jgi:disulfide oxidoreductase YuzD
VRDTLSQPHWHGHPEWIEHFLNEGREDHQIAISILSQPYSKDHPEWVETLLKRNEFESVASHVLTQPHWKDHPEWVEAVLKSDDLHINYYEKALSPEWVNRAEYIEIVLRRYMRTGQNNPDILKKTLSDPKWRDHPELRRLTGGLEPTFFDLRHAYRQKDLALRATRTSPQGDCISQSLSQSLIN